MSPCAPALCARLVRPTKGGGGRGCGGVALCAPLCAPCALHVFELTTVIAETYISTVDLSRFVSVHYFIGPVLVRFLVRSGGPERVSIMPPNHHPLKAPRPHKKMHKAPIKANCHIYIYIYIYIYIHIETQAAYRIL